MFREYRQINWKIPVVEFFFGKVAGTGHTALP